MNGSCSISGYKGRLKQKLRRSPAPSVQDHNALLNVMHYHDLNSFRAGVVDHPKAYRWSSYGYYAEGKPDRLLTPSPCYLELADTNEERRKVYRQRVEEIMREDGKRKRGYSEALYVGAPDWVLA